MGLVPPPMPLVLPMGSRLVTGLGRMTRLTVSLKTVEKHRANLMSKLNGHDLTGLIRAAIKHGLVFLDE